MVAITSVPLSDRADRQVVTNSTLSVITAGFIVAGVLAGLWLPRLLPVHHLSDKSQDTVKLGAGVIATMSALVLGLRVSSAKNSYDVASANVAQIGARFIELDELLAEYGPETMPLREQLKTILAGRIELLWHPQANALSVLLTNERSKTTATLQNSLSALVPASEVQKCFSANCGRSAGR